MGKVLLTADKKVVEFDNFEAMFQDLSEKGMIVVSVEDGKIITKDKKELSFSIVTTEGTKEKLNSEIEAYREKLRVSIPPLMKQGVFTKEQAGKLKEQFEFLDGGEKK